MKTGNIHIRKMQTAAHRLDPSLHLSEGMKVREQLNALPYELKSLDAVTESIFLGNIFSRIWVKDKEHGVPYLAASDTVLANLNTGQFLAKKQALDMPHLVLKSGWILITCSGTLGSTSYTNKNYAGKIATHDLIRVVPNENVLLGGYVYAFLSGRYGYYQITQSQFGGVVKHINATQAGQIQIPILPKETIQKVDGMIKKSSRLREEAAEVLEKAQAIAIRDFEHNDDGKSIRRVNFKEIASSHNKRFEGGHYSGEFFDYYSAIMSRPHQFLGELTLRIFRPGIFKRQYVEDGVTFLGGADILLSIPQSEKKLAYRQVDKIPELHVKPDWILITCGGTIGNVVYVDHQLAKCVISQHVMRIVSKQDAEIIFAFLSTPIGKKVVNRFTYGSVIPSVEDHHLDVVPIPSYSEQEKKDITALVQNYVRANEMAKQLELDTIAMVEQEIEKWSKE